MERKNLRIYEVLLTFSVIFHWGYITFITKIVDKGIITDADVALAIGVATSLFFYTMVVTTILALIHNVTLLEPEKPKEEKEQTEKMILNIITLFVILGIGAVVINALGNHKDTLDDNTPRQQRSLY